MSQEHPVSVESKVEGMDCPGCAATLQSTLSKLEGVEKVDVQFAAGTLSLRYFPDQLSLADIEKRVHELGYSLRDTDGEADSSVSDRGEDESLLHLMGRNLRLHLTVLAAILFAIGFVLEWQAASPLMVGVFYIGALLSGGCYIARSAVASARYLSLDMNVLMTIAIIGALAIGEWSEGVMVTVLFAIAQLLETRSMARARRAVADLMNLAPLQASVLREGRTQLLPVEKVTLGETILVRPGEHIPLDGVVTHGFSRVNQAPITGESRLIEKDIGAEVYAGTINENGSLEVRVTKAAGDTTLARITRQIEIAQKQKASSQRFVDRFAKIYTPCVIGLAVALPLIAWLLWGQPLSVWFHRSLVLLVIACPCALVISTPVAIVSALANAARNGVLIKGGTYLETLGRLKGMAFDKTGTLTQGEPQVTDVIPLNGASHRDVLQTAIVVESKSEHALARAILNYAERHDYPIEGVGQFSALPGKGAKSTILHEGRARELLVGTPRLFTTDGATLTKTEERMLHQQEVQGKTTVLVGFREDDTVCVQGIIAFADRIRPESAKVLDTLRREGIPHLTMLTGDTHRTAAAVAEAIHLSDYRWELLPTDKVNVVEQVRRRWGTTAMVGDGMNDAPALATADVGIAMGAIGTDATLEVADVVLIQDNLSALPFVLRLGRRTLRIIQANIAFALVTKLIFTLLAINGMATLGMAVFADMGASLLVTFNGLRLLKSI